MFEFVKLEKYQCRACTGIPYAARPVDPEHQVLDIYAPEAYFNGGTVNGYTRETAPVFFPNGVGGYMPGLPCAPGLNWEKTDDNATVKALEHGYVVATPAVRGRTLPLGYAPAVMVDLKAAVRFLKAHAAELPGDMNKIISNGTSAGGAISSQLGASGNHPDFEPYLEALGAEKGDDSIFAASCYCPITNLDHADMAYEWEFNGLWDTNAWGHKGTMTEDQIALSPLLKQMFPAYLNSLELTDAEGAPLKLDEQGEGSFVSYLKKYVLKSIEKGIRDGYDMTGLSWITYEAGKPVDIDWKAYVKFRTRMKPAPAFDNVALGTPENELYGCPEVPFRHFTEFSFEHSQVGGALADAKPIYMMNPMNYIDDPLAKKAQYYRIRHGAIDRDTSLAISAMLNAKLVMAGINVDYHLPWNTVHSGDYDLPELFQWIDSICK